MVAMIKERCIESVLNEAVLNRVYIVTKLVANCSDSRILGSN